MTIETTPNFIAFAGPHCACCGRKAERLLNLPGNILAPACAGCEPDGAIEVAGPSPDVAAALAEVRELVS